ncbi:hypothetical protein ACKWTF_016214 [Chironomus riparius]
MNFLLIFIEIITFVNFASSQIPIINLAANATASIAANSSQVLSTGTDNNLISNVILDNTQNQSVNAENQTTAAAAEPGSSDTSSNNTKISLLPVQIVNETESNDQTEDYSEEENFNKDEEIEGKNEAKAGTESDLTIDEVLLPELKSTEDSDEELRTQDSKESEEKDEFEDNEVQTPKPRSKNSKKSKKGRRIEKLVCHAEIEIDPEEPIFAENFEKNFE